MHDPLKLFLPVACALVALATIAATPAAAQNLTVNQSLDGLSPGYDSGGYVGLTLQQLMLALGIAVQGGQGQSRVFDANMRLSNRLAPRAAVKSAEPPTAQRLAAAPDEVVPVE